MKTLLFIGICFILGSCIGYSQANCSEFKDGTFKFTDPDSRKVCVITRDGDMQTERIEGSEETYTFNLKWVDECNYTVNPTTSTILKNKEVLRLGTMTVKITPASDSSYVQTVRVANSPKYRQTYKVFKVKE